jgi:ATP-dependent Lhr-like helicase
MEESGRIRRGYFAGDLGAIQFAMPGAVEMLRSLRAQRESRKPEMLLLAATDPANPYGALLPWPTAFIAEPSLTRSVGAQVVLCDGELVAYLRRANPNVRVFLPEEEPNRGRCERALAEFFVERVQKRKDEGDPRAGMLVTTVNGIPVREHPIAKYLLEAGFSAAPMGFNVRKPTVASSHV